MGCGVTWEQHDLMWGSHDGVSVVQSSNEIRSEEE